jgi:hypothetical protein
MAHRLQVIPLSLLRNPPRNRRLRGELATARFLLRSWFRWGTRQPGGVDALFMDEVFVLEIQTPAIGFVLTFFPILLAHPRWLPIGSIVCSMLIAGILLSHYYFAHSQFGTSLVRILSIHVVLFLCLFLIFKLFIFNVLSGPHP